jgi:hypothetical protein
MNLIAIAMYRTYCSFILTDEKDFENLKTKMLTLRSRPIRKADCRCR